MKQQQYSIIRQIARNIKSVLLRFFIACKHKDLEELLFAIIIMSHHIGYALCLLIAVGCFPVAFFKPHLFITIILFLILAGLIRSNTEGLREAFNPTQSPYKYRKDNDN